MANDQSLAGESPTVTVVNRQDMSQQHLAPLRLFRTLALASILCMFCDGLSAASSDLADLRLRLQELRAASSITLMIVPYRTHFMTTVDEEVLPGNSCTYEIKPGPDFDEVLKVIEDAVVEYKIGPRPDADLRVGIAFTTDTKVVQQFYFNDTGGIYDLRGFSGSRRIAARAGLPNQLRLIAAHPSVILVKDYHSQCRDR